jgi:protein-S-isoprenylcysteine O-methyltransferase Ste14
MWDLYLRTARLMLVATIAFFVAIFVPAWTLDYWQGWAFFAASLAPLTLITVWMAVTDPKLLERRLHGGPRAETSRAQKIFIALIAPVEIAMALVTVFDHRFGWSPAVPAWLSLSGDVLSMSGLVLYFFVIRENRYAAGTVRVEAGQTVCSTGPYAFVRHPMYAGAVLYVLGAPVALGSWWGLLFTPLFIAGFAWRSVSEEQFLQTHLAGYRDYLGQVRYRLVPCIW